jgi:hypothetical protein
MMNPSLRVEGQTNCSHVSNARSYIGALRWASNQLLYLAFGHLLLTSVTELPTAGREKFPQMGVSHLLQSRPKCPSQQPTGCAPNPSSSTERSTAGQVLE